MQPSVYLDLEYPPDRERLADAALYLPRHEDKLVILDEVHRIPDLFQTLRSLIDQGRRKGIDAGRFLLLGSASFEMLRQTGESLAGRIAYEDLNPFDVQEVDSDPTERLWTRGGFPDSYLAESDENSAIWRQNFIRTYVEHDIPQLGPRLPSETLRRFWVMLAHAQGGQLNASNLARGLGVNGKTVARYLDVLVDLLLVRRLPPYHANVGKRLVKSPKIYIRDSGIVHSLLGLDDWEGVLGHPVCGASWEGFVIENLLGALPSRVPAFYYRTAAGAEIDLVLQVDDVELWVVEIKRGTAPKLERGFHHARNDLNPSRCFVVYSGDERFALADGVETIGLKDLCRLISEL